MGRFVLMNDAHQCPCVTSGVSLERPWNFSGRETLLNHPETCYQSIPYIGSRSAGHWSRQDKKEKKRDDFPKIINIRDFYHGGYHMSCLCLRGV